MTLGPYMDTLIGLQKVEHRNLKPTNLALYLARDERDKFILADGIPEGPEYAVHQIVDGKSPFKLKDVNYIHFRCSRDDCGSKMLVSLKPRKPYELVPDKYTESDTLYTHTGKVNYKEYGGFANKCI